MDVQPQKEHDWLQKLVGEWTFDSECVMGPDQPPSKNSGTESVRSLGGLWTIGEGCGEMPEGGTMRSVMTLGYDPVKQRFVGSFIASMMTHFWIYDGSLNEAGTVLTLNAEGPSFTDPATMAMYQDVIKFKSDDHRILYAKAQGPDGQWTNFMTAHYKRTK